MSEFLGFDSALVALGSTIQQSLDAIVTVLTGYGWQIVNKSIVVTAGGTMTNPSYGFDGNPSQMATATTLPITLNQQYPSGFTPTWMTIYSNYNASSTAPKTFTLDYSDNGSSWTTLQTWSSEVNWGGHEMRKFTISGAASHAYWRLNVTAVGSATTTNIREWCLYDASNNHGNITPLVHLKPPSSETIGNSTGYDILRIDAGSNFLTFRGTQYSITGSPQVIYASPSTAGAVACSMTIGTSTVTGATGSAGSTSTDNLYALYNAIRASANADFTDWYWEWQRPAPQNADDATYYIYGVRKTLNAGNINQTSTNCTTGSLYVNHPSNTISPGGISYGWSVTTDLVSGFIYYLQVCKRGIALATKTNSATFGPIHACWGDNAKAVAATPGPWFTLQPVPIEFIHGYDDVTTTPFSYGWPGHFWGMSSVPYSNGQNFYLYPTTIGMSTFGCGWIRDKIQDHYMGFQNINVPGTFAQPLYASNFFGAGSGIQFNDFQIHRMSFQGANYTVAHTGMSQVMYMTPPVDITDWYKFTGTASDESLILVSDTIFHNALSSDVAAGDTTINVTSTTGFASAGFIIIEAEAIEYTGKTGTSFTGCTRGKYGTTATTHWTTDYVYPGLWFVKINTGALFAGYVKPT